jgi:hypothetical protein
MDPATVTDALEAHAGRLAGSDAERRAASTAAEVLGSAGLRAEIVPRWHRPHWPIAHAWHAIAAVAASVLSVWSPWPALALALVAAVSAVLDLRGLPSLGRLGTTRRASQDVVVAPDAPGRGRVRLLVVAAADEPRGGLARRPAVARLAARAERLARGRLPGPGGWLVLASLLVAAAALARGLGAEGTAVGAAQLVPTTGLMVGIAVLLDIALAGADARAGRAWAAGAGVAAALAAALREHPPEHLDVELALAGASAAAWPPLGAGALVRERRRALAREELVVLEIGPCRAGAPRWREREGQPLAWRQHRRLLALCAAAAADEAHLGAAPAVRHAPSGASLARQAGVAAVSLAADDPAAPDDPAAAGRVLELALALVGRLDAEVGAQRALAPSAA